MFCYFTAAKSGMNHCPLCHQNHISGEDGWKNHLMAKDGCKQNPRRLLALNKPQGNFTFSFLLLQNEDVYRFSRCKHKVTVSSYFRWQVELEINFKILTNLIMFD
jgi:hypothetical protein